VFHHLVPLVSVNTVLMICFLQQLSKFGIISYSIYLLYCVFGYRVLQVLLCAGHTVYEGHVNCRVVKVLSSWCLQQSINAMFSRGKICLAKARMVNMSKGQQEKIVTCDKIHLHCSQATFVISRILHLRFIIIYYYII
jgi:hypothetical protein